MRKGHTSQSHAVRTVWHRRSDCRNWRPLWSVLLLIAWVVPASAELPTLGQHSEAGEPPWLVTVIHRARVSDLVTTLRRRGFQVAALDGVSPTQHITNVTSGIVMDSAGRILVRLATISPEARPEDVTVITADGRTFHPMRVGCDESSGYSIIEVPNLGIAPPPFAPPPNLTDALPVQIISQVPDLTAGHEAILSSLGFRLHLGVPPPSAPPKTGSGATPASSGKVAPAHSSKRWPLRWKLDSARLAQRVVSDTTEKKHPTFVVEVSDEEWSADGGIVLNDKKEVIGVAEEVSSRTYVLNPIATLRQLVEHLTRQMVRTTTAAQQIKSHLARGAGSRPTAGANILTRFGGWLGIRATNVAEADEATRARLRDVTEPAVIITDVVAESPAARAGVRTGDVLLSFNGQRLSSVDHLAQLIATTPIGQEVTLDIWREGTRQTITTQIEERPTSFAVAPAERTEGTAGAPVRRPGERATSSPSERQRASRVTLSRLGLQVTDLTDQLAKFFGVADGLGILVTEVAAESPAARAGLRAGDIITTVNEARTPTRRDFTRVLRLIELRAATDISIGLVRDRQPLLITLRLSP